MVGDGEGKSFVHGRQRKGWIENGRGPERKRRRYVEEVDTSKRKSVSEPPTLGSSSSKQDFRRKQIDKEPESVHHGSLASKIPKWMPVSFKPPQGMWITNTEEEVAAYIFMSTEILEGKEILVRSKYGGKFGIGDRRSLQTLMPFHYVTNEQQALALKATPNTLAHRYRTSFMGYVDLISKLSCKSRMRLALDLVLDTHNNINDEVVNMANMTLTTFVGAWANFEV
ncbi:Ulp1 protease family, carboxy-terminal domain protein [Sesbania bispinosa]|nr:Ulp1 protease family, carboxy-terminal domain protein [Sesbania bispinosa]